ncbi:DUF4238 domain-containing protein (plasmid) [Deinococcus radiomollis]|uniref:DUF4238 domain-containing protein n=1 Tax=Deinococcus radiomollis TaxID=468916 RepID=UPI00389172A2
MTDRVKRGHYVPQGYLKAFADPARESQIFVLRREQPDRTFSNPVAKVASRLGFYDAGPGDNEQVIEHWFSTEVEAALPFLITRLIEFSRRPWYQRLPPDELKQLLAQMAIQFLRTNHVRETARQRLLEQALAPGGEAWRLVEEMSIQPGISAVEIQEARIHMDGPAHMGMIMNDANINGLINDLKSFTWQLCTTNLAHPFVTSDAPVVIVRPPTAPPESPSIPMLSVAVFPLTPTALLRGEKTGRSLKAMKRSAVYSSSPEWVLNVNRLMFSGPQEQLLGSSREALLSAVPERFRRSCESAGLRQSGVDSVQTVSTRVPDVQ